jgi:protein-S-isoprenylcysteine O-methyltransferase Ste14
MAVVRVFGGSGFPAATIEAGSRTHRFHAANAAAGPMARQTPNTKHQTPSTLMKLLVFGILSLPLLALSWRSMFSLKRHGLYRFALFECILWLAVRNHRHLIVEEFDLQQVASSVLMLASLAFVLAAVFTMRSKGRISSGRDDPSLFTFERTTALVETGIFRLVRHPMYSSLLFLVWGILLRRIEAGLVAVACGATVAGVLAAWIEEKENLAYFGEAYRRYAAKTKRFVPFVI